MFGCDRRPLSLINRPYPPLKRSVGVQVGDGMASMEDTIVSHSLLLVLVLSTISGFLNDLLAKKEGRSIQGGLLFQHVGTV